MSLDDIWDGDFVMSCASSSAREVASAIRNGANVNAKTDGDWTPLMMAAANNIDPEVLRVLINAGAIIDAKNVRPAGETALWLAVERNTFDVVKVLIDAGANVNAVDKYGYTVLMIAAEVGTPQVVGALLDAGANAMLKSNDGWTALDCTRHNSRLLGTDALERLKRATHG